MFHELWGERNKQAEQRVFGVNYTEAQSLFKEIMVDKLSKS